MNSLITPQPRWSGGAAPSSAPKTPPVGVNVRRGHMTLNLLKNNDFDFKMNNKLIIIITGEALWKLLIKIPSFQLKH